MILEAESDIRSHAEEYSGVSDYVPTELGYHENLQEM